ncbi:hypothetical protein CFC21_105318 [Triticum aestivum]|uniref:Uncharacterized protein n=2 Tax=Triticum aestivum TaxID=4565 RepID=A0A3B6SJW8_WHEAT|nr:hypothetical protein CFC21_105318 [Triticum aestivum]
MGKICSPVKMQILDGGDRGELDLRHLSRVSCFAALTVQISLAVPHKFMIIICIASSYCLKVEACNAMLGYYVVPQNLK